MLWNRLLLGLILLLNLFFLYSIVLSDQGIFSYLELRRRNEEMTKRIEELRSKTVELSREIRLLESDNGYIQKMIRQQMNFVRQRDILYVFPQAGGVNTPGVTPDEEQD